jgi:competence protein ComEC
MEMAPHNAFFLGAFAFLLGVLLSSAGLTYEVLLILSGLEAFCVGAWSLYPRIRALSRLGERRAFVVLTVLLLLIPVGSLVYRADDARFRSAVVPFDVTTVFSGIIVNDPVPSGGSQKVVLELEEPLRGHILLTLAPYPTFEYGDRLSGEGAIERPEPAGYAAYLAKERVSGVVSFPAVGRTGSGFGSPIRASLFSVKHAVVDAFKRVLPAPQAAFMSGLTVGERGEFSSGFKDAMQRSGTTHLVALSGYNISIVVWVAMAFFLTFMSRRWSFALATLVVVGFVLMTGAEASVVRAAIMGILALSAREVGRRFDVRNAIAFAGVAMVIANPKVLLFDVGFQLSFLALMGIVYLGPALRSVSRLSPGEGFLSWRENLVTTTAAQLAVVPLLIGQFGGFSLTSLIANVLVLSAVPFTMGIGFIVAAASFLSYYLSLVLGWVAWVLLSYEMLVIELFSALSVPIAPAVSWLLVLVYYGGLALFIAYARRNERHAGA